MNYNSINFDCWRGKSLEFFGIILNIYLFFNFGVLIVFGLIVVC